MAQQPPKKQVEQDDGSGGTLGWIYLKSAEMVNHVANCVGVQCNQPPASFKISANSPLTFNLEYVAKTDFADSVNFAVGAEEKEESIKEWRLIGSDGRIFKFKNKQFRNPKKGGKPAKDALLTTIAQAQIDPSTTKLIGRFDGVKEIIKNAKQNEPNAKLRQGTATFVTSDLLITCAHNVWDGHRHLNLGLSQFKILNPAKNSEVLSTHRVDWVVYPNHKLTRSTDIAFIKLKTGHQGNGPIGVPITSLPSKIFADAENQIIFSGYPGEMVSKSPNGPRPKFTFTNADKNDDEKFYNSAPAAIKMKCDKTGFTYGASGSVGWVNGHSGAVIYSHGETVDGKPECYTAFAHRITHNDFWVMCALSGDSFNAICGPYGVNEVVHKAYDIMMNDNYIKSLRGDKATLRRIRYHAKNEYDNQDSYEESEQDLYGHGQNKHHEHHGHNDYNDMLHDIIVYNPNLDGGSHHDTISDGYYHESGGYDHIHNESEYLVLYSIVTMILIGVCCLIIAVSSIFSFAAGKFHQTIKQTQKPSLHCKHEYDQIDVITEDQI